MCCQFYPLKFFPNKSNFHKRLKGQGSPARSRQDIAMKLTNGLPLDEPRECGLITFEWHHNLMTFFVVHVTSDACCVIVYIKLISTQWKARHATNNILQIICMVNHKNVRFLDISFVINNHIGCSGGVTKFLFRKFRNSHWFEILIQKSVTSYNNVQLFILQIAQVQVFRV